MKKQLLYFLLAFFFAVPCSAQSVVRIPGPGGRAPALTVTGGSAWLQSTAISAAVGPIVQQCGNSTQHCTITLTKTSAVNDAITVSLESFGSGTSITIISAYSCATLVAGICDPSHSNVIDTFTGSGGCSVGTATCAHNINGSNDNIDMAYVAPGAGGANFVTVNASSDPNLQPGFDYYLEEGRPPNCNGSTCSPSLDTVASCNSSSTPACGSATLTATDFMLGSLDTASQVTAHNYQIEQTGNLFDIDLTAAPAFSVTTSGYWTTVHLYFKSSGGSYTPPTAVFSYDIPTSPPFSNTGNTSGTDCHTSACNFSPGGGNATLTGDAIILWLYNGTFTSVTRTGETWVTPTPGSGTCGNSSLLITCAYTLSSAASSSFMTISASCTSCFFLVATVKRSTGSFVVDNQGSASSVGTTVLTAPTLTLTGSVDVGSCAFAWTTSTPTGVGTYLFPQPGGVNLFGGYGATQPAGATFLLNSRTNTPPAMQLSAAATTSAAGCIYFK